MFARFIGLTVGFAIGVYLTEALFPNNQSWPDLLPFAVAIAGAVVAPRVVRRLRWPGRHGFDDIPESVPRRLLAAVVLAAVTLIALFVLAVMLGRAQLVTEISAGSASGMAPTLPACNGRWLAEGFTYHLRDPERGEIVAIHARRNSAGRLTPDRDARGAVLTVRVIGTPGDSVVGREGHVYVNGGVADQITTSAFTATHLGHGEYFVLGDNRSADEDSRAFGSVPRKAIFARVVLVDWPLGHFGVPGYDKELAPPGPGCR